ncbi:MAG: hypothetical protein BGO43_01570 [Gammaproteobacteria bacterium 39-13]|nr:hypothetical protein [Gammaproteobacteria bacterium]OJV91733.1 MAG: hypothetical protein BGO43_01570 [Gammaproteobacteria bacterium 39-13]
MTLPKPIFAEPSIEREKETIQVYGTFELLTKELAKLSLLANLHFFAQWVKLKNTGLERKILPENEQSKVERLITHWKTLSHDVALQTFGTECVNFRLSLEKKIINDFENGKENSLVLLRVLKALVSKGNTVTAPDPQLIKIVEKLLEKKRIEKLENFKEIFKVLSLPKQGKILDLLASKTLQAKNIFRKCIKVVRIQLQAITSPQVKLQFINDLVGLHQAKLEKEYIEKPRKQLLSQWAKTAETKSPHKVGSAKTLFEEAKGAQIRARNSFRA